MPVTGTVIGTEAVLPGAAPYTPPAGSVHIHATDPLLSVVARLNETGLSITDGGPRYDTQPRIGRTDVPRYVGHSALRGELSIILDGYARRQTIKPDLDTLQALATVHDGQHAPPAIRLTGNVDYTDRTWRLEGHPRIDDSPRAIRDLAGVPLRMALTVVLIEVVADTTLSRSVARAKKNPGPKATKVRDGETDFGDVSKRLYRTRNRARDLARKNGLPLGTRLRSGQSLRLP